MHVLAKTFWKVDWGLFISGDFTDGLETQIIVRKCWLQNSRFISVQHRHFCPQCLQYETVCIYVCVSCDSCRSLWSYLMCAGTFFTAGERHRMRAEHKCLPIHLQTSFPPPTARRRLEAMAAVPQHPDISIKCTAGFAHYRWPQRFPIIWAKCHTLDQTSAQLPPRSLQLMSAAAFPPLSPLGALRVQLHQWTATMMMMM